MRKLDRGKNIVTSEQSDLHNQAKRLAEMQSYKQEADENWKKYEDADKQAEQYKQELEKASGIVQQEQQTSRNLLQRLKDAIASRDSMRGRLGNMTAQRNQANQRVELLTVKYKEAMVQVKAATERLIKANQRRDKIEAEYDQDMTELADAYQEMNWEQRQQLPPKLRKLLEQVEQEYKEVK